MGLKKGGNNRQKHNSSNNSTSDKTGSRGEKQKFKNRKSYGKKNYQSPEECLFVESLKNIGLQIRYMDGDGNCLFRSIADQISGNQDLHHEIRSKVVNYITKFKDQFILFMEDDEPFDDYIDRMR